MGNEFIVRSGTFFCLAAACACALGGCGGTPEPGPAPKDQSGPAATPPETGPVVVGDAGRLAAHLAAAKGKVAVVNLWATWCPPCVAEMPELVQFYKAHVPDQAALLSVSLDDPASAAGVVRGFHKDKGLPFDVLVLSERNPDALRAILQTEISGALPTTLLYDRTGKLIKVWEGAITREDLEQAAAPLL